MSHHVINHVTSISRASLSSKKRKSKENYYTSRQIKENKIKIVRVQVSYNTHQALECLKMLTFLEFLCHKLLIFVANKLTVSSRVLISMMELVLRFFMEFLTSMINHSFFLLFLMRTHLDVWECSLIIGMVIDMGV